MTSHPERFRISRRLYTDRYLHIHIRDIATAVIKDDDEGIVVDIYPFKDLSHESCASTWAHLHDLQTDENPPPTSLTEWQRTALTSYDLGEFRYLAEAKNAKDLFEGLRHCGDGLLRFIIAELSEREDCASFEDAVHRMTVARNQLTDLIEDLHQAADKPHPPQPRQPRFRVAWSIDVDASHPRDAAHQALAIHRDGTSIATHHDTLTGETASVDLEDAPAGE